MIQLLNLLTRDATTAVVTHNGTSIKFNIGSCIATRVKSELNEDLTYRLPNLYLDWKGEDFKTELMSRLQYCNNLALDEAMRTETYPLPYGIINPLLELVTMEDMFQFLKYVYQLPPPSNLEDVFDDKIESDGRGSRIQTYLKDDYLELAALCCVLKIVMLPVYTYAHIMEMELSVGNTNGGKEYMLCHLLINHPIFNSNPMVKLKGLVEILIDQSRTGDTTDDDRVLEKGIPRDELPLFVLSLAIIHKLTTAPLIGDNEQKNIITVVYNFINSKLKTGGEVSKTIRTKTALKDVDGIPGDGESYIESHRQLYQHAPSDLVEFEWALSTADVIVEQLNPNQKQIVLKDTTLLTTLLQDPIYLQDFDIDELHVSLLSIGLKSMIDPRCLYYISRDGLTRAIAVIANYYYNLGYISLASMLLSQVDKTEVDTFRLNNTGSIPRLTKEHKDNLDLYYPYKKSSTEGEDKNLIEEWITDYSNKVLSYGWWMKPNIAEVLKRLQPNLNVNDIDLEITKDIKNNLAGCIIANERLLVG